ncbi:uncharacterized protein [Macrobrachium rosenbergii]|uniref:uncharacterized protein n=1 Tax=Macrobrachium rosenbergii TaxID=79674 RepID=UPI0034D49DC6
MRTFGPSDLLKVLVLLGAIMATMASPDGTHHGLYQDSYHHGHHSHHDPYHGHHKPYYFDYKAHDYYGGSYHHSQKSDGYNKQAAYDVYYPDGKSTLSVKIGKH